MDTHVPGLIIHLSCPHLDSSPNIHLAILKRRVPHLFHSKRRSRRSQRISMAADTHSRLVDQTLDASAFLKYISVRDVAEDIKKVAPIEVNDKTERSLKLYALYSIGLLSGKLIKGKVDHTWDQDMAKIMSKLGATFARALRQPDLKPADDHCIVYYRTGLGFTQWVDGVIPAIVQVLKASDADSVLAARAACLPKIMENLNFLNECAAEDKDEARHELLHLAKSIVNHLEDRVDALVDAELKNVMQWVDTHLNVPSSNDVDDDWDNFTSTFDESDGSRDDEQNASAGEGVGMILPPELTGRASHAGPSSTQQEPDSSGELEYTDRVPISSAVPHISPFHPPSPRRDAGPSRSEHAPPPETVPDEHATEEGTNVHLVGNTQSPSTTSRPLPDAASPMRSPARSATGVDSDDHTGSPHASQSEPESAGAASESSGKARRRLPVSESRTRTGLRTPPGRRKNFESSTPHGQVGLPRAAKSSTGSFGFGDMDSMSGPSLSVCLVVADHFDAVSKSIPSIDTPDGLLQKLRAAEELLAVEREERKREVEALQQQLRDLKTDKEKEVAKVEEQKSNEIKKEQEERQKEVGRLEAQIKDLKEHQTKEVGRLEEQVGYLKEHQTKEVGRWEEQIGYLKEQVGYHKEQKRDAEQLYKRLLEVQNEKIRNMEEQLQRAASNLGGSV
ncbi:hypothetical protein C8Q76DRAFT_734989 [Earliella scabrosa]|nr:hypothetical protein C8Q76DRAFT_734989 [Earliella scabrosa]